jgi:hypothetical protein
MGSYFFNAPGGNGVPGSHSRVRQSGLAHLLGPILANEIGNAIALTTVRALNNHGFILVFKV